MDSGRLRQSFSHVAMHGDELPLYSDLLIKRPEVGDLFPISMGARRGDFVAAPVTRLTAAGPEHDHIHIEDFRWSEP